MQKKPEEESVQTAEYYQGILLTFIHTTVAFRLADIVHDTGRASPICLVTSPLGFKDKSKSVKQKICLKFKLQEER